MVIASFEEVLRVDQFRCAPRPGHVDDIFPYFIQHAREMFPHLDCMEDLKKISDLRLPANWSVNIIINYNHL